MKNAKILILGFLTIKQNINKSYVWYVSLSHENFRQIIQSKTKISVKNNFEKYLLQISFLLQIEVIEG